MATQARAEIDATVSNGPYAYTWKADASQNGYTDIVNGKTLAQSYNAIGTLALALPGTIKKVVIMVVSE